MSQLVNLVPHDLVIMNGDRFVLTQSGQIARVDQHVVDETLVNVGGALLTLATVRYGTVTALPEPRPGVLLVVSRAVATEVARADLVFPDLEIRDEHHRVIGCQRLARFALA
jgi:hypothetical protein